ncbi:MAG: hypothetical protein KDF65_06555 [Anaerolineae bacterium]|nr:hypothetical protein [Anaerolineae bacterium]
MSLLVILVTIVISLLLRPSDQVLAYTHYLVDAQNHYPVLAGSELDDCNLCHLTSSLDWPNLNVYGQAYQNSGYSFVAIQNLDTDGDGYTNLVEINALSAPGNAADRPILTNPVAWVYLPALFKAEPVPINSNYTIIGWNDLGMHCMDPDYADFSILPPYNTLWAQVIRRGKEPELVTENVTVEYRIINNTYSVVKTDFWDYAHQLFNLPQPLLPNVGLTGAGLNGQMHPSNDHFVIEGVPLTEYRDNDLTTRYPYQIAELVAKDNKGNILATTQTVAPVSTELNCQNCHNDNGSANPTIATGVVKQNILTLHDSLESTTLMNERPVLCANCHSSNALGLPGVAGVPSLSRAIHNRHSFIDTLGSTMEQTCYQCHPGVETKCLRDEPHQDKTCQSCHGGMSSVANPARTPWVDEPRCETCHDTAHAENSNQLYRFSTGHGQVYCQACHGSQHAIYPSLEPNDNIQSTRLQGHPGTIDTCTVCHTTMPEENEGPHQGDNNGGGDD